MCLLQFHLSESGGVPKSGLLVVLGGPDRAIPMCLLQFHEQHCNILMCARMR